jgi:hypothetical protein
MNVQNINKWKKERSAIEISKLGQYTVLILRLNECGGTVSRNITKLLFLSPL